MGCLSLQFLRACTIGSSKIKVMTVDGMCLKYEAPLIVKEVMMDYPLHSLFDSEAVRVLGDRARPLHSTLPLQPGHVYFLLPQAAGRGLHCACTAVNRNSSSSDCACTTSAHEMASSSCMQTTSINAGLSQSDLPYMQVSDTSAQSDLAHMQVAKCSRPSKQRKVSFATVPTVVSKQRKVSFATVPTVGSTQTLKSCVQLLPSPSDGVIRVKMVVSKTQLASVLKNGGDCISMVEGLLSPLLESSRSDAAAFSTRNDTWSDQLSWRPSLESIPESLLPMQ